PAGRRRRHDLAESRVFSSVHSERGLRWVRLRAGARLREAALLSEGLPCPHNECVCSAVGPASRSGQEPLPTPLRRASLRPSLPEASATPAAAKLSLWAKEACSRKGARLQACFAEVRLWCSLEGSGLSVEKASFSVERRVCGRGRGWHSTLPCFAQGGRGPGPQRVQPPASQPTASPCRTEELSPWVARPGRVSTLTPRSPLSPRRCWRHPRVPGVEAQGGSVCTSSSASERRRCAFGEWRGERAPSGKRDPRAEGWVPCSVLLGARAASLFPGQSGACWANASS
ncbi:unnamed protein product, partial [Soboliphyme baturini]|uniref:Translation initiation factor IF-2-like n=1 Tax=Soboliphyme baturini TaxID=241478 RepID=A0A183IAM7_9BILA